MTDSVSSPSLEFVEHSLCRRALSNVIPSSASTSRFIMLVKGTAAGKSAPTFVSQQITVSRVAEPTLILVHAHSVDLVRDQMQILLLAELSIGQECVTGVRPSQWVLGVAEDLKTMNQLAWRYWGNNTVTYHCSNHDIVPPALLVRRVECVHASRGESVVAIGHVDGNQSDSSATDQVAIKPGIARTHQSVD